MCSTLEAATQRPKPVALSPLPTSLSHQHWCERGKVHTTRVNEKPLTRDRSDRKPERRAKSYTGKVHSVNIRNGEENPID